MNMMTLEQEYFLYLLSSIIQDKRIEQPDASMQWDVLYALAKRHSLSGMLAYGIDTLAAEGRPAKDILAKFQHDKMFGIAREATQQVMVEQLLDTLEHHEIACMPLKGYIMKNMYPSCDMRTMSDVDIYFHDEDSESVKQILLDLHYEILHEGGNHDVYCQKPYMNIEMHRDLMHNKNRNYQYFKNTWSRVAVKKGKNFIYEFSDEDFLILMIAHVHKHLLQSGSGIRSILDIWVYLQSLNSTLDWDYLEAELRKIQLWKSACIIMELGNFWFSNGQGDETLLRIADYIFRSSTHGTQQISNHNAMYLTAKGKHRWYAKFKKNRQAIFRNREYIAGDYPYLNKYPFLLPFAWCCRFVHLVLHRRSHVKKVLKSINLVTKEQIQNAQFIFEEFDY